VDELGLGTKLTMSDTGLRGQPDLINSLQHHANPDFVTITGNVRNNPNFGRDRGPA
jgi:hypothetical protein